MPTQLTSTSRPPNASVTALGAARASARRVASPPRTTAPGTSSASRAALASSRSSAPTWAPSWANASSTARPIPEPAPTTRARLPSSQAVIRRPSIFGPMWGGQELTEKVVVLPGQGLELQRAQRDLAARSRHADAQPHAVAGLHRLHHDLGELVPQPYLTHRNTARFWVR